MRTVNRVRRGAQRVRLYLGVVVVTIWSAACTPSPTPSTFNVDYYREHHRERKAKLELCSNDPGALGRTTDCVNAREAARIESIGSIRDLPPLQLPTRQSGAEGDHKEAPR